MSKHLYPVAEQMPAEPKDITPLERYSGYFHFGKYEMESLATYIFSFSLTEGRWVGVSVRELAFATSRNLFDKIVLKLPAFLGIKTKLPEMPSDDSGVRVHTVDILFGGWRETTRVGGFPASFVEGIRLLLQAGAIRMERIGNEDVLFPTPQLVRQAVEKIAYEKAHAL